MDRAPSETIRSITDTAAVGQDQTARRQTHAQVGRFDQSILYRAIIDSATDYGIIAADLAGRVIEWNVGAQAALGWPASEILGKPIALIFTPEDRQAGVPEAEMRKALQTGHAMDQRWHMKRDGSRFWADGRMMPLADDTGETIGYLKIVRNETARKLSAAQAISATALRLITDHIETAIVQVDLTAAVVFANPAAARLFGWSADDLIGRPIGSLIGPDTAVGVTSGQPPSFVDRDMIIQSRVGETRFVTCSQAPILVDGEATGAVLTLQDAARRRQADEAMRAEVRRHEALAHVQRAIESAWGDPDAIYRAVAHGALAIMGQVDAASIELLDGDATVNHIITDVASGDMGMRVPLAGSLAGAALARGQAVVCRDTETDDRVDRERSRRYGVRSMIVVPIPRAGSFVGVLKLCARRPDAFMPRDLLVAHILVGHIATAHARMDEASALRRLQRSEERLQLALEASETIGIWDWDIASDRCYGDARFARLFAVDPAEAADGLPIRRFMTHVHPEDLIWIKGGARRAMAEHGEFAMEFRVLSGAAVSWLFARGRVYDGAEGKPTRFLGAVVDITERKRTETSLRDAETNARLAVEAAGLGLWDYAIADDRMTWDDRCRSIVGLDPGIQPTLDLVVSMVHLRSRPQLREAVTTALASASLAEKALEFEIVRQSDGESRWIEASAQAFFTDGVCTRIIGTIADISERKRMEAALREDEQRFRTMAESIPQLAWMANASGAIVWFNERWFDYVGREPADTDTSRLRNLTHPDIVEAVSQRLSTAFAEGTPWEDKLLLRGADGHYRWFLSRALPLRRADGAILHWFGTHTDIHDEVQAREAQARFGEDLERQVAARTEELSRANDRLMTEMADRQRAEEALRQSQKMEAVGQLTGGIAHDFNNLLTGITGSLDLMRRRIEQGRRADVDRYMSAAVASANRAAALTHRLLAFARRQPLDPKPVDLNALTVSMEDLFRRTLGETIDIALHLSPHLWTTLCDPHQLENALLNLVINARDAMPDGGQLTIATANVRVTALDVRDVPDRRLGDYVDLTVSDTGVGMPADVMARIFEPFFTTKPIGQGTGLGLSMIYGFARQSDGHVAVQSRPGEGTRFTLQLPRFGGTEMTAADPDHGAAPGAGDGETVLVVEDDPVVRELVLDVLADLGYRTLEAHDGFAGLAILQGPATLDLMVTDVGLPGLNGRQLAEMGRESRPDLKVLFMTGYAEDAVFGRGVSDATMQMITKPFAIDTLAARIREMIEDGSSDGLPDPRRPDADSR